MAFKNENFYNELQYRKGLTKPWAVLKQDKIKKLSDIENFNI